MSANVIVFDGDGERLRVTFVVDANRIIAEYDKPGGALVQLQSQTICNSLGELCTIYSRDGFPFEDRNIERTARALYQHVLDNPPPNALAKDHTALTESETLEEGGKS